MIQEGTRQFYNFKILEIIEKNMTNKLIIEDLGSVMERIGLSKYTNIIGIRQSPKTDKELLIQLKEFFIENLSMRFLQGLINLGFIEDSMDEWVEESVKTYLKIKKYE